MIYVLEHAQGGEIKCMCAPVSSKSWARPCIIKSWARPWNPQINHLRIVGCVGGGTTPRDPLINHLRIVGCVGGGTTPRDPLINHLRIVGCVGGGNNNYNYYYYYIWSSTRRYIVVKYSFNIRRHEFPPRLFMWGYNNVCEWYPHNIITVFCTGIFLF